MRSIGVLAPEGFWSILYAYVYLNHVCVRVNVPNANNIVVAENVINICAHVFRVRYAHCTTSSLWRCGGGGGGDPIGWGRSRCAPVFFARSRCALEARA